MPLLVVNIMHLGEQNGHLNAQRRRSSILPGRFLQKLMTLMLKWMSKEYHGGVGWIL